MFKRLSERVIHAFWLWWNGFSIDQRSLGLFRVGLGVTLFFDAFIRFQHREFLYSNLGVSRLADPIPGSQGAWSILSGSDSPLFLAVFFALYFAAIIFFTTGVKTKFFHVLVIIGYVSLSNRLLWTNYAGHCAIANLLLWTLFLPMDARFALQNKVRPGASPFFSLTLAVQIFLIYFVAVSTKIGQDWHQGLGLYRALSNNIYSGSSGEWLNVHAPSWLLLSANYGTLLCEYSIAIFLFARNGWRWVAIIASFGLQAGIILGMNLGVFPYGMLVMTVLLLRRQDWDWISKKITFLHHGVFEPQKFTWGTNALGGWLAMCMLAASYNNYVHATSYIFRESGHRYLKTPEWVDAPRTYLYAQQYWSVFAPSSKDHDDWLVPVGLTTSGHYVDLTDGKIIEGDVVAYLGRKKPQDLFPDFPMWEIMDNAASKFTDEIGMKYVRALLSRSKFPVNELNRITLYWFYEKVLPFERRKEAYPPYRDRKTMTPFEIAGADNFYVKRLEISVADGRLKNLPQALPQ